MFHKKAKTTKKVVLRLECTSCKTKAQLSLKRCKHFELGYEDSQSLRTMDANETTVVTRRRRVLLWSSSCVHSWRTSWHLLPVLGRGHVFHSETYCGLVQGSKYETLKHAMIDFSDRTWNQDLQKVKSNQWLCRNIKQDMYHRSSPLLSFRSELSSTRYLASIQC